MGCSTLQYAAAGSAPSLTTVLRCYAFPDTMPSCAPQADHIEKGYVPRIAGERLPATYINHYTANGGAVVPQFGFNAAGTDERALEDIYQAYNGERKVPSVCQTVCDAPNGFARCEHVNSPSRQSILVMAMECLATN